MNTDTASLCFEKTITNWDEALPLGNGDLGCLIWNGSSKLRFSLDKGGIWDCSNPPEEQEDFTYDDIKKLVKTGRIKKLQKKYDDCYNNPTPTKLPAGKLILDLGVDENVVSRLDFFTAEATVSAGDINLKSFVFANGPFGIIEINKSGIKLSLDNPKYGDEKSPRKKAFAAQTVQSLKNLNYKKAEFYEKKLGEADCVYFVQPTTDAFYGIVALKKETASKTLIAYSVAVGKERSCFDECIKKLGEALKKGYDGAFKEHCNWWRAYWDKSRVTLPDKRIEKQWYLNNYLLGCCSRKGFLPMPLQGVWTADNGSLPPWKGDYHHDLNTQMSYSSYLKAGRNEQGECFIDYLLKLSPKAREFAKSFYKASGLCLPSVMDVEGHALGGWCQYALSPTNQLWLCHIMARYYFVTKNEDYYDKIYSYMLESGEFLFSLLKEENGVYKLPLSTSPEIHDNTKKSWLKPNSNYDLALIRAFLGDMIDMCAEKNKLEEEKLWRERLEKIEELAVSKDGVLMISSEERLKKSHRHHSHCMAIYPLRTLEYTTDENKRIIDSTVKDLEKLGSQYWVGYSLGWMAELYIAKGDGDKCLEMLNRFYDCCCTENGFHVNGDFKNKTDFVMKYRLFTLEGNFLATDAVQDMLLYGEHGEIELFPAIPKAWQDVAFSGFCVWGGITVDAKMKDGRITFLRLKALSECTVTLKNDLSHIMCPKTVTLKKGESVVFGA